MVFDLWSFATDKLFLLTSAMDAAFLSYGVATFLDSFDDHKFAFVSTHEYLSGLSFIPFVHFS